MLAKFSAEPITSSNRCTVNWLIEHARADGMGRFVNGGQRAEQGGPHAGRAVVASSRVAQRPILPIIEPMRYHLQKWARVVRTLHFLLSHVFVGAVKYAHAAAVAPWTMALFLLILISCADV
jgi:hypothetical protein